MGARDYLMGLSRMWRVDEQREQERLREEAEAARAAPKKGRTIAGREAPRLNARPPKDA